MPTDHELLRDYAHDRSESALTELVRRHVNMVYSAALRETHGDVPQAEDITQAVFTEFARQAAKLSRHPALAGWLYTCVRQMTANVRRSEDRRERRELEAHTMKELLSPNSTESNWRQLQPVLDDAMHELSEADRAVVVLRFFEDRSHAEVGLALGLSDTAARKRVDRALEKLRALLGKRGVTSTASGLTAALAFGAVITAPTNLAATVAAGAVVTTASTAATTFTLFNLVTMTKLQAGLIGAIVVAGVATPLVMQHQAQVRLSADNEALRQQVDQLTPLIAENERLSNHLVQTDKLPASPTPASDELLRLRAQVTRLRTEAQRADALGMENLRLRQQTESNKTNQLHFAQPFFSREGWVDRGTAEPTNTLLAMLSAMKRGDEQRLTQLVLRTNDTASIDEFLRMPKRIWNQVTGVQLVAGPALEVLRGMEAPQQDIWIKVLIERNFDHPNGQHVTDQSTRIWNFVNTNGQWLISGSGL